MSKVEAICLAIGVACLSVVVTAFALTATAPPLTQVDILTNFSKRIAAAYVEAQDGYKRIGKPIPQSLRNFLTMVNQREWVVD